MKLSHTSTNSENLVKISPVYYEITAIEVAPLRKKKIRENISRTYSPRGVLAARAKQEQTCNERKRNNVLLT